LHEQVARAAVVRSSTGRQDLGSRADQANRSEGAGSAGRGEQADSAGEGAAAGDDVAAGVQGFADQGVCLVVGAGAA
jgi:hypothetical protein